MRGLLGVVFFVSGTAHIYLTVKLLSRLQRCHSQVWEALGKPRWWGGFGVPRTKFLGFLVRREYRGIEDDETVRIAEFALGSGCLSAAVFGALILNDLLR